MRELEYLILVLVNLPILMLVIKNRLFYESPLFTTYFYSFLFLNILGSCVVFIPELNIYKLGDIYTKDFFFILLIQCLSFYLLTPIFCGRKQVRIQALEISDIKSSIRFRIVLTIFSIFILALFYLKYGLPPLLKSGLSGGNSELLKSRNEFFEQADKIWFYRIGMYVLPQIIGVISYLIMRNSHSLKQKLIFFVVAVVASVLALSFLHKTPVALFWMCIFIAKVLYERKSSVTSILKWSTGVVSIIILWYFIYFPGQDSSYYLGFMTKSMLNRVFGVYPISLAYVPHLIEQNGLYWGTTMLNPLSLFPYEVANISMDIHWMTFNYEGYAPPPAIGYAFADFGYLGVVLTCLFIGVYLFIAESLFKTIKNSLIRISITSFLCLKVMFLATSSSSEILLNPSEFITIIIIFSAVFFGSLRYR